MISYISALNSTSHPTSTEQLKSVSMKEKRNISFEKEDVEFEIENVV